MCFARVRPPFFPLCFVAGSFRDKPSVSKDVLWRETTNWSITVSSLPLPGSTADSAIHRQYGEDSKWDTLLKCVLTVYAVPMLLCCFLFQDDFEEAVQCFLKAIEISTSEPRYVSAQKYAWHCQESWLVQLTIAPAQFVILSYCTPPTHAHSYSLKCLRIY